MPNLTGVAIDTLRAWERRHSAVTPIRDDRGRMYTDADIARLRLLRGAVERGHSIGHLASLTDTELRHLAAVGGAAVSKVDPTRRTPIDTALLTAALQKYDATAIDQQSRRLASVLPPLAMLRDVLMPVLAQVGEDWHRGYLGPDLPAREIVDSVGPAGAQVLVLGLTATVADKATARELRTIVRDLPKEVELWAGGRGAARHAALISPRGLVLRDYNAYQQELVRIGGRVVA